MSKYRCEYKYTVQYGAPLHIWSVVGAKGGMHLSIRDGGEDNRHRRYSGGIEQHSRTPTSDTAPTHDKCWLLGGPCWHDGSSLAAIERWIPLWEVAPHDHDRMFRLLEAEADERFGEL